MAAPNIAFEAPECGHQPRPSGSRPVDLVHLACQTGGDKSLESEVLALFARQARQSVNEMARLDTEGRKALAHKILGSAKGIGAFEVARCAGLVEARPGDLGAVAAFTKAVVDADNFIVGLSR
ncbi:hypothetical protein DFR52_1011130 [Hoeflea marina]|uniref:Hpt domain-containing protein n=1 Tax=Hoeflea marina TaxID=274592 RepID=A0A317PSJ6_9HYPH|nr:Hpt domain-containing protein [Hoeflea marina]PWW04432.1 hypothetical protein DFR52_1011130 [Hoeflea marina]